MPINNAATLAIDSGNYYQAPVDTAMPASFTAAPTTPWVDLGNSSLEDIMTITSDGGDTTVLGTLQNKNLRTRRSNRTETFTINLQQFDSAALQLYYGSNATITSGVVQVPASPTPTVCAFLAVFKDGANSFAFYAPKVEIIRGDDINLADTESLVSLPLSITPLQSGSNNWLYKVTALGGS